MTGDVVSLLSKVRKIRHRRS